MCVATIRINYLKIEFFKMNQIICQHKATLQINIIFAIVASFVLAFFWWMAPVITILPILLYLALARSPKFIENFLLILIASTFGLINYTKLPESDLLNYYNLIEYFRSYRISDFDQTHLLDSAFYIPTIILAHITDASGPIFILFWTSITYYMAFIALMKFANLVNLKRFIALAIIGHVAFVGYNFGLSGHIVRQYAAMSFLLFSFVVALSGDKRAYIFLFIASLLHHSALIFFPIIYFSILDRVSIKKFFIYAAPILLFSFLLGATNLFQYLSLLNFEGLDILNKMASKSIEYIDKDDGDISLRVLVEFLLITTFVVFVFHKNPSQIGIKFLFLLFFFWVLMILTRSTDLLLLRYFFYGFGFFSLALIYIAKTKSFIIYSYLILIVFTSLPRFLRAMEYSDFTYIFNDINIIFTSVSGFIG